MPEELIDLSHYVYQQENALSADFCDQLVYYLERSTETCYSDSREHRVCLDLEIPDESPFFPELVQSYRRICCAYFDQHPWALSDLDPSGHFFDDGFMLTRYEQGVGHFAVHTDQRLNIPNPRLFSTIWYLNTVETGGETHFPTLGDLKIHPEKGKAIHFPANWLFPHAGCIPVTQRKYIVTTFTYARPYNPNMSPYYV